MVSATAVAFTALASLATVTPASASVSVIAPISTIGTPANVGSGYGVSVSSDGRFVATAFDSGGVTIFEVATGAQHDFSLTDLGNPSRIDGIDFSVDNQRLFVATANSSITVINTSDFTVGNGIALPFSPVAIEASQDGDYLYASVSGGYELYKIDIAWGIVVSTGSRSYGARIMSMCLSTDGETLFVPSRETVDVIATADMSLITNYALDENLARSCEMDNVGNLFFGSLNQATIVKMAQDGTILASIDLVLDGYQVFSAVPSCDELYVADNTYQSNIPVLSLSTLEQESVITPDESNGGDGFYGYNGDRSLDGSIVAISGANSTDGLVIISSPECAPPAPTLPDTGIDSAATGMSLTSAAGFLLAGTMALVARRRRVTELE